MQHGVTGLIVSYYDRLRERTVRAIEQIPPDRLEWRLGPDLFSCGDLVRHLAGMERWMWAETVFGRPSRYSGHGRDLADGYEAVVAYHAGLTAQARDMLATLADGDLMRTCRTPAGTQLRVWKWLRAMFEHEAHHRGQLYLMLRLVGASPPPLFGLTAEEVRAASLPAMQAEL